MVFVPFSMDEFYIQKSKRERNSSGSRIFTVVATLKSFLLRVIKCVAPDFFAQVSCNESSKSFKRNFHHVSDISFCYRRHIKYEQQFFGTVERFIRSRVFFEEAKDIDNRGRRQIPR